MRVIGINIKFTCSGKPLCERSFMRNDYKVIHLGREPADACNVANAFVRGEVVPPVMSRKHAEIVWIHDVPQVMDIGSYHGTYFRDRDERLVVNQPYELRDGSVLEFGKSVTKDDKAHEPLQATIQFIREVDRMAMGLGFGRAQKEPSGLFSPASPPRRYAMPSDSDEEDEDEDDDEDDDIDESENSSADSRSDIFEYAPEGLTRSHIDLTNMSDDEARNFGYNAAADTDGIEYVGFGYAPGSKNLYDDDRVESSSDMSESENEAEVVAPAPQRIVQGGVSSLEAAANVHVPPVGPQLPRVVVEVPREPEVNAGPSEEVRGLRVELDKAMHEIVGMKAVLRRKEQEEEEKARQEVQKDKDGDVQIAEGPALDVPSRIANIENMFQQLAAVGDVEICEHRSAIQEMLGQLACDIEALRVRVGGEPTSPQNNNKRKRVDEDEEEEERVEARRAQSPMPALELLSAPVQVAAPPAKRSRLASSALVIAGGAAMWSALAFDLI